MARPILSKLEQDILHIFTVIGNELRMESRGVLIKLYMRYRHAHPVASIGGGGEAIHRRIQRDVLKFFSPPASPFFQRGATGGHLATVVLVSCPPFFSSGICALESTHPVSLRQKTVKSACFGLISIQFHHSAPR